MTRPVRWTWESSDIWISGQRLSFGPGPRHQGFEWTNPSINGWELGVPPIGNLHLGDFLKLWAKKSSRNDKPNLLIGKYWIYHGIESGIYYDIITNITGMWDLDWKKSATNHFIGHIPLGYDTMWPPPVLRWFINPIDCSYLRIINNSYWSCKTTWQSLGGPTLYI